MAKNTLHYTFQDPCEAQEEQHQVFPFLLGIMYEEKWDTTRTMQKKMKYEEHTQNSTTTMIELPTYNISQVKKKHSS